MAIIEVERRIRAYQQPLHSYMVNGGKRAIQIGHRRWGKDEIALDVTCELAHRRPANYWHCLPEYAQARKALWAAINPHTGRRRIDEAFPPEIRARTLEQEMFIEFRCGSTWQLIGSDRYNATVGASPAGIVYSEWALANPSAWAYQRPMLEENNGWALFITTPRGKNHAFNMYQRALKTDGWFANLSTVHDTKALSPEQLEEALAEYQDLYGADMGQAYFAQEYLCSFNAAILGAFYGAEFNEIAREGRITNVFYDDSLPVHTAWDLGYRDDTSIWWYQVIKGEIHIIDFFTVSGYSIPELARVVLDKPYRYGRHHLPHDAKARTLAAAGNKTIIEQMAEFFGLESLKIVPDIGVQDGIQAARRALKRSWFDASLEDGIEALRQYRREWDDENRVFRQKPLHDWASNPADAFRMLAVAWQSEPGNSHKEPVRNLLVGAENTATLDDMWATAQSASRYKRI